MPSAMKSSKAAVQPKLTAPLNIPDRSSKRRTKRTAAEEQKAEEIRQTLNKLVQLSAENSVNLAQVSIGPNERGPSARMGVSKSVLGETTIYHREIVPEDMSPRPANLHLLALGSSDTFSVHEIKLSEGPWAGRIAFVVDPSLEANEPFRLLDLPVELRANIFNYALIKGGNFDFRRTTLKPRECVPRHFRSVLLVCKIINAEAGPILYNSGSFSFAKAGTALKFLDAIGENAKHIRSISLDEWPARYLTRLPRHIFILPSLQALHITPFQEFGATFGGHFYEWYWDSWLIHHGDITTTVARLVRMLKRGKCHRCLTFDRAPKQKTCSPCRCMPVHMIDNFEKVFTGKVASSSGR